MALMMLALALMGSSNHVLVGMTPENEFRVESCVGTQTATSDALGILAFTVADTVGPCWVSITPAGHIVEGGGCAFTDREER